MNEKEKIIQNPYILGNHCSGNNNTGKRFEEYIYEKVKKVNNNKNKVYLYKKYYSLERQDYITVDISIEKYVDCKLFSVIVIECKDYKNSLPVDDVEEFHSKLQQIGADNTKGVMVTSKGMFQKSAITYAKSKGISLACCCEYDNKRNGILYNKAKKHFKLIYLLSPMHLVFYIRYLIQVYNFYKYNFCFAFKRICREYDLED